MLQKLEEFRDRLDAVMHRCMGRRIVLYGYGYSGRFAGWYAEYYHGIKPDYIVMNEWTGIPYEFVIYQESLFDFQYKDVKDAVVWLCLPETEDIRNQLESHGYKKGTTYFNFCEVVYGSNYETHVNGADDVQFLTYLEHEYGCDFVTRMNVEDFRTVREGMHPYVTTTPKEIFPILDKCHCHPAEGDAIFDFGCGKGSAMITFLDYGFRKVGGVEYEDGIYGICINNFQRLGFDPHSECISCIHGDAARLTIELDAYNWFYYFDPFDEDVFEETIQNICQSLERRPRKTYLIVINPRCCQMIADSGYFVLTNQFDTMTRQRVVDVFVTKKKYCI